jgi:hypothetical protein
MNALVQLLAMALAAVVVVLAFVPTGVDADCQLALTTWYSKQGNCEGQSGCSAGMVPNGCSKLGDQWVDVDCSNERVLIYSTQVHLPPVSVVLCVHTHQHDTPRAHHLIIFICETGMWWSVDWHAA